MIADIGVPTHDEGFAVIIYYNAFCLIIELAPHFLWHWVKNCLFIIQLMEVVIIFHDGIEILQFYHLTGVGFHEADICTGTNKAGFCIVNDADTTQFLFVSDMA